MWTRCSPAGWIMGMEHDLRQSGYSKSDASIAAKISGELKDQA